MSTSNSNNFGSQFSAAQLNQLLGRATTTGTLSAQSSSLITGNLGNLVVAGAAGMDAEDITAADVTLITMIIDKSSSIAGSGLEQAVRDGQNALLDAMTASKEADAVMCACWTFNHAQEVVHAYVPVSDATRLDPSNYRADGTTHLYDTWIDALTSNVAYAQSLRDAGTPCRSIVVVVTDGYDCGSKRPARACKTLSEDLLRSEQFVLAFVGVGPDGDFKKVARSMGIPDKCILVQSQATPSAIRQAFTMVSQSAIRASQGLIQPGPATGFFV